MLQVNTTLTSLNLRCDESERNTKIIKKKVRQSTDNKIRADGAIIMSEMLRVNTTLTSLNLWGKNDWELDEKNG